MNKMNQNNNFPRGLAPKTEEKTKISTKLLFNQIFEEIEKQEKTFSYKKNHSNRKSFISIKEEKTPNYSKENKSKYFTPSINLQNRFSRRLYFKQDETLEKGDRRISGISGINLSNLIFSQITEENRTENTPPNKISISSYETLKLEDNLAKVSSCRFFILKSH